MDSPAIWCTSVNRAASGPRSRRPRFPSHHPSRGSVVSLARIGSQLSQILHLHESPHRTALAFAVGAFIAFSPTYGLHTLSVAFCTWAFRLNCVALLAGSLINNPWTVLPIVGATV